MTSNSSAQDTAGAAHAKTSVADTQEQYSLARMLGIWALAAIPMAILSGTVFPALSPDYRSDPLGAGVTRVVLLTVGLIWQFVLSMIIVRLECGDLAWTTVKRRLRHWWRQGRNASCINQRPTVLREGRGSMPRILAASAASSLPL
jgi:hypothetical protein